MEEQSAKALFETVQAAISKERSKVGLMLKQTDAARTFDIQAALIELADNAYECDKRQAQSAALVANTTGNNKRKRHAAGTRNKQWPRASLTVEAHQAA